MPTSAIANGHAPDGRVKPNIVFLAAALKHVPILERDWSESVKTNIFGSVNVADAARAAGAAGDGDDPRPTRRSSPSRCLV
jgi:nucleoside-diphosphate-sugar epimerase